MPIGRVGWLKNLEPALRILGRVALAAVSSAPGRDTGDNGSDSSNLEEDPEEDPDEDPEEDTNRV